ncbi:MAG: tRNA dihydrouridine synthase DusB [Hornefia sp.]|nr:tRNA dihydrouridine synthase DusB [Hornefia sp.]
MRMNKIGDFELKHPFILAPLAGITDAPMRRINRQMGASLTYSEMVSAKGMYYNDKNTEKLLFQYEDEDNTGYQIFGHEPDMIAYAAEKLNCRKHVLLDINMGCPVPKIVKNGEGSALLKNPELVEKLVRAAVQNTDKPVTAKIRIGFYEGENNAVEVAQAIESGGASAVAVHGRTRAQFYSGKADWNAIAEVKKAIKIPVIGNGDVTDVESAKAIMEETRCDFVMIGRGALGNPWIFRDLQCFWEGKEIPKPPTLDERREMMMRQLQDLVRLKGEYVAVREMRKVCGWYVKGLPGSAEFRRTVNSITDIDELKKLIIG